ncbi:hypothetical protein [Natronomonas salsuginis]|uniref:Uncharacterized protein n=1 Tax=Natronomonas salsuginis TaxID=2217661 RepID=A0A4U5J9G9_9EURY|nr:hypothetical protein [Natronomonas salsuginis]TKR25384.1 hypothetical protein DM868_11530 [Natronomonas salsuginis]
MSSRPSHARLTVGVAVAALGVTTLVHIAYLPRYLPDEFTRSLPYLALGWLSYGLLFYALGRLKPALGDGRMPTMRATDVGIGLFLFSIVLSGLIDTAGLTIATAPALHALPGVGVYVGLALAGWGFGIRTRTVNEIAAERR